MFFSRCLRTQAGLRWGQWAAVGLDNIVYYKHGESKTCLRMNILPMCYIHQDNFSPMLLFTSRSKQPFTYERDGSHWYTWKEPLNKTCSKNRLKVWSVVNENGLTQSCYTHFCKPWKWFSVIDLVVNVDDVSFAAISRCIGVVGGCEWGLRTIETWDDTCKHQLQNSRKERNWLMDDIP